VSELDPDTALDESDADAVVDEVDVVEVLEVVDAETVEVEVVEVLESGQVVAVTRAEEDDADASEQDDADASDARTDARLEGLDDGSAAVAGTPSGHGAPAPEALPFTMSAREHFAVVDALEGTGDARVDAATARLEEVPDLPTADHVEVYEDVHRRLQDALSEAEVR
jgi:hypothetical protein